MREITVSELNDLIRSGHGVFCYSRCMWCGRQTPHEWCHACTAKFNAGKRMRADRWRFDATPEECSASDVACEQNRITTSHERDRGQREEERDA